MKKTKVVFAETTVVDALESYVQQVLASISKNGCKGASDAFVSDESKVGDFTPFDDSEFLDCDAISRELGVRVTLDDYVVALATKLSKM